MEENKLEMVLEALLFVSRTPATTSALAKAAGVDKKLARDKLQHLRELFQARGIILDEIAGGWQLRTNPRCSEALKRYLQSKPMRLSKPALDTISIIAYMQPITRAGVEDIRSVDTSGVIKFLVEHGLIRIIGKMEEPGRPFLYGTTKYFLEFFGLKSLSDMPRLQEQIDLTQEEMEAIPAQEDEQEPDEADLADKLASVLDGEETKEDTGDSEQ